MSSSVHTRDWTSGDTEDLRLLVRILSEARLEYCLERCVNRFSSTGRVEDRLHLTEFQCAVEAMKRAVPACLDDKDLQAQGLVKFERKAEEPMMAAERHRFLGDRLCRLRSSSASDPLPPELEEEILAELDQLWYQMTDPEHEVEHRLAQNMPDDGAP